MQSQIRRGAVSVPANLVEGCARRSERDYLHFVGIAIGSASEVRYVIGVAVRLGFATETDGRATASRLQTCDQGSAGTRNFSQLTRGPRPEARGPRALNRTAWACCAPTCPARRRVKSDQHRRGTLSRTRCPSLPPSSLRCAHLRD
ncbi:MAG TPA: four helix bundle protein [Polyangia bacterium]|nr:four helix bundle protein [Polyangia bacterium]